MPGEMLGTQHPLEISPSKFRMVLPTIPDSTYPHPNVDPAVGGIPLRILRHHVGSAGARGRLNPKGDVARFTRGGRWMESRILRVPAGSRRSTRANAPAPEI